MNNVYILLIMIFCHIVDDYYLQKGILNLLKQKSWWKENAPQDLYKFDYIMGLCMHAFSWSFVVHIPLMIISKLTLDWLIISILVNALIHGIVDDLKANRMKINLIIDQLIHIMQIFIIFIIYFSLI